MKNISKTIIIGAVAGFTAVTAAAQELPDSAKVNVAFRSVEQSELMGGVSAIDMENLEEKDYTSYSLDDMTSLVGGFSGYNGSLWGMGDALILVDGVPRDANNVLPNEIAQITFLKSAQAVVLYGSRGAKGVILITTKKGSAQTAKVSVDAKWGSNTRALQRYDVITDPGAYYEAYYNSVYNYYTNALDYSADNAYVAANNKMLSDVFSEIDQLEKTRMDINHFSHTEDDYMLFAWLTFIFVMAELVIRYTVTRSIP